MFFCNVEDATSVMGICELVNFSGFFLSIIDISGFVWSSEILPLPVGIVSFLWQLVILQVNESLSSFGN